MQNPPFLQTTQTVQTCELSECMIETTAPATFKSLIMALISATTSSPSQDAVLFLIYCL